MNRYMDDQDRIEVRPVCDKPMRSVRGVSLTCGHRAEPGERYFRTAAVVDGEFFAATACVPCRHYMMTGTA